MLGDCEISVDLEIHTVVEIAVINLPLDILQHSHMVKCEPWMCFKILMQSLCLVVLGDVIIRG